MKHYYAILLLFLSVIINAQTRDVTFAVDMSSYGGSFTTVYVSGEFNGWSGTSNPLTDLGGGIWSATIPINDGDYEYKFSMDDWAAQETFTAGAVCTVTSGGFVNRFLSVTGSDIVLPTPVFEACAEDNSDPGPHDITFSVDMGDYGSSFTNVYVSGTFNGWSGTANALVDQGSGIWSVTVSVTEAFHEFKFSTDDWADQESFTAGDPYTVTNGGFTNRILQADTDKSLSYVWNQGEAVLSNPEYRDIINVSVYPNPSNDSWNITTPNTVIKSVEVFNVLGKKVFTQNINTNSTSISVRELASGIYLAKIYTDIGTKSMKLVRN